MHTGVPQTTRTYRSKLSLAWSDRQRKQQAQTVVGQGGQQAKTVVGGDSHWTPTRGGGYKRPTAAGGADPVPDKAGEPNAVRASAHGHLDRERGSRRPERRGIQRCYHGQATHQEANDTPDDAVWGTWWTNISAWWTSTSQRCSLKHACTWPVFLKRQGTCSSRSRRSAS